MPERRREAPPRTRELAVDRLEQHEWSGRDWHDDVRAIDPALLDRPELDADALALLRRVRSRPLPCLYLRLLDRAAALQHLDVFVTACRSQQARYVRVITGKGINSFGEPVLKRAVLGWCDEAGLARALELDQQGEWGSLIIDLGAPR
jgi:DNA-nicking Smr family endonuclease